MARAVRQKVRLVSSGGTGHFYTTTVNKKTATAKLSRRKYDPRLRRHVRYDEAKI